MATATDKITTTPPAPAPVAEQLPQAGGSYTRQPDGSLLPAAATPTDTPEQE